MDTNTVALVVSESIDKLSGADPLLLIVLSNAAALFVIYRIVIVALKQKHKG